MVVGRIVTKSLGTKIFFSKLKKIAADRLKKKLLLHPFHRYALFFNPKMRMLKPLTSEACLGNVFGTQEEHRYAANSDSRKRRKVAIEVYEDDEFDVEFTTVQAEIDKYRQIPVPSAKKCDILLWWKSHAAEFPRLSELAKHILCIPATSASSERNFSVAGLTIGKLRTKLHPKHVDDILFLRSNFDITEM